MKTLYIECNMGAAGDMLMAALYELLEDQEGFLRTMNSLGLPGVRVEARAAATCGIAGTHMAVTVHGEEETDGSIPAEAGRDSLHSHDHDHEDHAEDSDEIEYDEHIWTSPVNAGLLAQAVCDALTEADPEGADYYAANLAAYQAQLHELDAAFRQVVAEGKRDILVFGDRFPLLYFCKTYGLRYRAAFQGCSSDTEPSVKTLAYLIDKVNEEHIPVVYHLELSSEAITNVICESTGAKSLQFHSCHNLSREDFEQGATYLSLMWQNVEALKEGLA